MGSDEETAINEAVDTVSNVSWQHLFKHVVRALMALVCLLEMLPFLADTLSFALRMFFCSFFETILKMLVCLMETWDMPSGEIGVPSSDASAAFRDASVPS